MDRRVGRRVLVVASLAAILVVVLGLARHHFGERITGRSEAPGDTGRPTTNDAGRSQDAATSDGSDDSTGRGSSFQVRDLADAQPVAGIRVRARQGSVVAAAEADRDGRVVFAGTGEAQIDIEDAEWTALAPEHNKPFSTGVFWVYRRIHVKGVVRAAGDGFDPRKTTLKVLMDGRETLAGLPDSLARDSVFVAVRFPEPPSAEGSFEVTLPRVHGLVIAASAHGWKPDHRTIDVSGGVEQADVELWLGRAFRLRGVLRSSEGKPLAKVPVSAYSLVRMPASEVTRENLALLQPQGGFTGSVDLVTGKAFAKFMSIGSTDKDGRFDLSISIDGELVLVTYPYGHRPVEVDLGVLNRDRELDLTAERVQDPRFIRLISKEKPLPSGRVFVGDLSLKDGSAQPGQYLTADAEGRISADWFVAGRRYYFDAAGFSGHMIWNGEETIDVARDLRSVSELPRIK